MRKKETKKVYKYTSTDYIIDAIENGIYAGKIEDFNDPYEYEGIEYKDHFRVCCLTTSPKKMLMWAYYGNHRECCIEFEIPEEKKIVRSVNYVKDYYEKRDMNEDQIFENLYTKAYEWKEENEIRIVYHKNHTDESLWNVKGEIPYFKAKATKVVFGLQCNLDSESVQDFFHYIEVDKERCKDLKISKCMLDDKKYQLKEDPQFDYREHIR